MLTDAGMNMEWLNSLLVHFASHPMQMFALLFMVAFSKSTVLISTVLPPASVMLVAALSASHLSLPPIMAWLAVTAGATLGSLVSYHLGLLMTHSDHFHRVTSRHEETLLRVRSKLQRNGAVVLFTSRFIALLRYLVPLAAGMLCLNPGKVYGICLLSSAIWAALFVGVSAGVSLFLPLLF